LGLCANVTKSAILPDMYGSLPSTPPAILFHGHRLMGVPANQGVNVLSLPQSGEDGSTAEPLSVHAA